jgi:hypothetical protein
MRARTTLPAATLLAAFVVLGWLAAGAPADDPVVKDKPKPAVDPKAVEVVKVMGAHLGGLKQFSLDADETLEDILEDGQKVQFSNRRHVVIARPNRVWGTVEGDTANNHFVYGGKGLHVLDKDKNTYVTLPVEGPLEKMLDEIHQRYGVQVPLADLLFPKPDQVLLERVKTAHYLGKHQVDGIKCHHVACAQDIVDWQLWIDAGEKPWPRKLVITYKKQPGAPQYEAVLRNWNDKPEIKDEQFRFDPPKDAKKIDVLERSAPSK